MDKKTISSEIQESLDFGIMSNRDRDRDRDRDKDGCEKLTNEVDDLGFSNDVFEF